MSKARDLGNLLDTDGDVVSGSLDNVPTPSKTSIEALGIALPADNLTGSIAEARFPSTALNSNLITKSTSEPTISTNPSGGVGTTWLRTTTGEMYCCTDATAGANVWTNIGDGVGSVSPYTPMVATGGTITTDGDYKVHSFTSSGNFQITTLGDDAVVEYLVVAGAGGGGATGMDSRAYGGGGGAGGYRTATDFSVSATTYTITVGGGGTYSADGSDSVFSSITSISGGAGNEDDDNGASGGSGGGGGGKNGGGSGGAGTAGQGYAGGSGSTSHGHAAAGGGGGANAAGGDAGHAVSAGGDGGDGKSNDITGSAVTYAGGGGGCNMVNTPQNNGGAGGGGDGGYLCESSSCINESDGNPGTANTGGGGGGGARTSPGVRSDYFRNGGTGGSGIVIIRYKFQQ